MKKLVIKSFHITKVEFSNKTYIANGILYLRENILEDFLMDERDYIINGKVTILYPANHNQFINSILDFSPIAVKALGRLGEGITHALTGVCTMLTAVDEAGVQVAGFGSSEGILKEQVIFNRPGTPKKEDIIIHLDLVLKEGMGAIRSGPTAAHRLCDRIISEIRACLKTMAGRLCDEKYEYFEEAKPGKKKVVIIKQVAGQGAMYDTQLLAKEPGGFEGGRSIIDLGNMPVILSPNEYRDGALRAMH